MTFQYFCFLITTLLLCFPNVCFSAGPSEFLPKYYWRDYFGAIPHDAFAAGKNLNGDPIYIGQGYIQNGGLIVGQINAGTQEILVEFNGVVTIHDHVKILCGPRDTFTWLTTTSSTFLVDLLDAELVIGGHEMNGAGPIHIGRISAKGENRIGKVVSFQTDNVKVYYVNDEDATAETSSYEILTVI